MAVGVSLRELLIDTVSQSGYARRETCTDSLIQDATNIGVLPEILIEARARYRERLLEKREPHQRFIHLSVSVPESLVLVWREYVKGRGTNVSTFFCSVIHEYLRSDHEPKVEGKSWVVRGKLHIGNRYYLKTKISYAAHSVLVVRAAAIRRKVSPLVRGILTEAINGDRYLPGQMEIVLRSQMFSDPSQYYVPDGVVVPRSMQFGGNNSSKRLIESYGVE